MPYVVRATTPPARAAKRMSRPAKQATEKAKPRMVEAPAAALTTASGGRPTLAERATAAGPPVGCESHCNVRALTQRTHTGARELRSAWVECHREVARRDATKMRSFSTGLTERQDHRACHGQRPRLQQ
jgi:hypothetical protein